MPSAHVDEPRESSSKNNSLAIVDLPCNLMVYGYGYGNVGMPHTRTCPVTKNLSLKLLVNSRS